MNISSVRPLRNDLKIGNINLFFELNLSLCNKHSIY